MSETAYIVTIPEPEKLSESPVAIAGAVVVAQLVAEGTYQIVDPPSNTVRIGNPNELSLNTQEAKDLKTSIANAKDSNHTLTGLSPVAEGGVGFVFATGVAVAVSAYRRYRR